MSYMLCLSAPLIPGEDHHIIAASQMADSDSLPDAQII
jgi:hypothetical protein